MTDGQATFKSIKDQVRLRAARGNSLDPLLDRAVNQAVLFAERAYDYPYMRRIGKVSVVKGSENVSLATGGRTIKAIQRVTLMDCPLTAVPLERLLPEVEGMPTSYSLYDTKRIRLYPTPSDNVELRVAWLAYSAPLSQDDDTNGLLEFGADFVIAHAGLYLAETSQNDKLVSLFLRSRQEAFITLRRAADDAQYTGQNLRMNPDWRQESGEQSSTELDPGKDLGYFNAGAYRF